MAYPVIAGRRMAYDIDGTEIGYRYMENTALSVIAGNGVSTWLSSAEKGNLNKIDRSQEWGGGGYNNHPGFVLWFFFPEEREINNIGIQYPADGCDTPDGLMVQGSIDSTNGIDGTWETAVCTLPTPSADLDNWRKNIFAVSFSGPKKVFRFGIKKGGGINAYYAQICGLHIYGQKAAGQTPDDIIFCNSEGTEKTVLKDWGDVPEGSTLFDTFYLKNVSTKIANALNLQLNNPDYVISFDQVNWGAVLDIASLGAGQISAPIYVKLALGPPLLVLGPRAARCILTVGSFT